MKTFVEILAFSLLLNCLFTSNGICDNHNNAAYPSIVVQQVKFDPNNTETWIINNGVFNQDLRYPNTPGFQWPNGSGKFAIFSSSLILASYVNNQYRIANGMLGEFAPGYDTVIAGIPTAVTDYRFKLYKVSRGDNMYNNQDWLNWGLMVPYGAPYVDVNANNIYEPAIDTPGVKGASQTIFVCLTDGFPESHVSHEGFGGGTLPLFAEVHLTAWGYNNVPGIEDVQFLKWDIINKNIYPWNSTYFGLYYDPNLGCSNDDYIGCDSSRQLGFCYNGDNDDEGCSYAYGPDPPAVGMKWLTCFPNFLHLNSFVPFPPENIPGFCSGGGAEVYQIVKGFKGDGSWWLNPKVTEGSRKTKYVFSGEAEGSGWHCSDGIIDNCGGDTTGNIVHPTGVDWRFVMAAGADNFTLNTNQSKTVMIAQFMARGSNNLNSITKLKLLDNRIQSLCDSGLIGIHNINATIPNSFYLYQNYPNPFNPATKIKFDLPKSNHVKLVIYDVLGKEIAVLLNQKQLAGTYEVDWNGTNYTSGVYFYKLVTEGYSETKKMVLLK